MMGKGKNSFSRNKIRYIFIFSIFTPSLKGELRKLMALYRVYWSKTLACISQVGQVDLSLKESGLRKADHGIYIQVIYSDWYADILTRFSKWNSNAHNLPQIGNVEFITDHHVEIIKRLKESDGKDIWLIGGGKVNSLLFLAGLINEIIVFIIPIILNGSLLLFAETPNLTNLKLINSKISSTGVQELRYRIIKWLRSYSSQQRLYS